MEAADREMPMTAEVFKELCEDEVLRSGGHNVVLTVAVAVAVE